MLSIPKWDGKPTGGRVQKPVHRWGRVGQPPAFRPSDRVGVLSQRYVPMVEKRNASRDRCVVQLCGNAQQGDLSCQSTGHTVSPLTIA